MAMKLISQNYGVVILGRDIGKNLIRLATKIAGEDRALPIEDFRQRVLAWQDSEISKAEAKGQDSKIASINDRAGALLAIADGGKFQILAQLIAQLQKLFSDEVHKITLSTGHRAKGLEWDYVVHLNPNLIPSKYARMMADMGNSVQMTQDLNLKYVIETRSKDRLILAHLDDCEGGKE